MTKEIFWLSLVFILILAICVITQWEITDGTDRILEAMQPVEMAIQEEDWASAQTAFIQVRQEWEKTSMRWKMLINHDDMGDIDVSIVNTAALLKQEEKEEALTELAILRFYLRHVHANENPDWGNIL